MKTILSGLLLTFNCLVKTRKCLWVLRWWKRFQKRPVWLDYFERGYTSRNLPSRLALQKKGAQKEVSKHVFQTTKLTKQGLFRLLYSTIWHDTIIVGLWRQFEKSLRRIFDIYCHGGHLAKNGNFSPFMALKLLTIKMPSWCLKCQMFSCNDNCSNLKDCSYILFPYP